MKYYFEYPDSEICYLKSHFIELMVERELSEIEVHPAEIMYGSGYFYCNEVQETGESGVGCGRFCNDYKPRNGKNGRCVHHSNPYEASEKSIILKL